MGVRVAVEGPHGRTGRSLAVAVVMAALLIVSLPAPRTGRSLMAEAGSELVSVIVRENPGSGERPEILVEELGGSTGRQIDIIHAFEAKVPANAVDELAASADVHSITPNRKVHMLQSAPVYDPTSDVGSMYNIVQSIGAPEFWRSGYTGKGVDVALIDTGVVPVQGLDGPGQVVNGVDLSFESQSDDLRYLDSFGHGTHMAGIIAGNDLTSPSYVGDECATDVSDGDDECDDEGDDGPVGLLTGLLGDDDAKDAISGAFLGVAPEARIINVKVGDYEGAADVSQVLAAIDWVVQHRNDNGMNIRVLNLSFGTDGVQSYKIDPLAYAAEVAWRKGIVVVASGGNAGYGTPKLDNPAYDPFVLAVGSAMTMGTRTTSDDLVAGFSSRGDGGRNPDLLGPGQSVVSLRAPGSYLDETYPAGIVGERFFRGSGTSQAAAAVSGAAALVVQKNPTATPDQVKKLLVSSAKKLLEADPVAQGAGLIDLHRAYGRLPSISQSIQTFEPSTGLGSLQASRGTAVLADEGVPLAGEQDIFGNPWDGPTWAAASLAGRSWSGGYWNGVEMTGDCWCADSWAGRSWSGRSWSGRSWSGRSWSSLDWSGRSWSGRSWSGRSWSGRSWSGRSWSGNTWSSASWGF